MVDIPAATFFNYFIYLLIPFILGFVAGKIKLSPLIGYLLGGVVVGNLFQGVISHDIINNFAFFGIVLLFFAVGLEVNFSQILAYKRFIIYGGIAQIVMSTLAISAISLIFQFNLAQSIMIGIALSVSSTTLVAKLIQESREEGTFLGEVTLGILMFQDLAFIPFLVIFTSITTQDASVFVAIADMLIAIATSAAILYASYYVGSRAVPVIFNKIGKVQRELLNFFIIVFIFFVAYASSLLHIPILVGAFVAGVLVSQTTQHYHIFSQIRTMRDILATFFFIYIGSNIALPLALPLLPQIILFTLAVVVIKAIKKLKLDVFVEDNWDIVAHLAPKNEALIVWLANVLDKKIDYPYKFYSMRQVISFLKHDFKPR